MVSILIPTAKRPDLLVKALQSISEQTALGDVVEVIVSESAGDARSGEVCQRFPQLPIQYILRDPQLKMTEHFSALKNATWKGELTAILHDDDWWTPDYLRNAIKALADHPQSSAYCCSSYYVTGESTLLGCNENLHFWFGADYPALAPVWEISAQGVLLASLIGTPAHYSALVARAEHLRKAAVVYETGNTYDADRMISFELSRLGTIACSPLPYAFYRWHANQLTETFAISRRNKQMEATTEWVVERAGLSWEKAGDLFAERARRCPPAAQARLRSVAMESWCLPLLAKHAPPSSSIRQLHSSYVRLLPSSAKKWARYLLPPALLHGASKLRKKPTKPTV